MPTPSNNRSPCSFAKTMTGHHILEKVAVADLQVLYTAIESMLGQSQYKAVLPMCWLSAYVPAQYVLTILYFHLWYHLHHPEILDYGIPGGPFTVVEKLHIGVWSSNTVDYNMRLSDFRQWLLKQISGLALPNAVYDSVTCYVYLQQTMQALQSASKIRTEGRCGTIAEECRLHPDNIMQNVGIDLLMRWGLA